MVVSKFLTSLTISGTMLVLVGWSSAAYAGGDISEESQIYCVAGCQTRAPQVVDAQPGILDPGFIDHEPEVSDVREVAKYFWCEPGFGCTGYGEPHVPKSADIHIYYHDERW